MENEQQLPTAQKIAEQVNASLDKISNAKISFYGMVHSNLRQISIAQSKIRDFENSLAMLKEALGAQKKHFNELEHLEKLPGTNTKLADCMLLSARQAVWY